MKVFIIASDVLGIAREINRDFLTEEEVEEIVNEANVLVNGESVSFRTVVVELIHEYTY